MSLVIGVPTESENGECRVAIDPATARKLSSSGHKVIIQKGAGKRAYFPDNLYSNIDGVTVVPTSTKALTADLIIKVQPPSVKEVNAMNKGSTLISYIHSYANNAVVDKLAKKQVSVLAMELLPRITRAQSMDTLSSQAAIAGYKAVLRAADIAPIFFPMLTYAAGSIRPAKVLVIGTGVAGLQAIATAKRLGAIVEAYDVRPETREQVESLGAKFVQMNIKASGSGGYARELTKEEVKIQQDTLKAHICRSNIVITTAAIPSKPSPKIVSKAMVEAMAPGSVIIDLGADGGGNVAITKKGKTVDHKGVSIVGMTNVASTMPIHASEMYSKNIYNLLAEIIDSGKLNINTEDEVISSCLLLHLGNRVHPSIAPKNEVKTTTTNTKKTSPTKAEKKSTKSTAKPSTGSTKPSTSKPVAKTTATKPTSKKTTKTGVKKLTTTKKVATKSANSVDKTKAVEKDKKIVTKGEPAIKGKAIVRTKKTTLKETTSLTTDTKSLSEPSKPTSAAKNQS